MATSREPTLCSVDRKCKLFSILKSTNAESSPSFFFSQAITIIALFIEKLKIIKKIIALSLSNCYFPLLEERNYFLQFVYYIFLHNYQQTPPHSTLLISLRIKAEKDRHVTTYTDSNFTLRQICPLHSSAIFAIHHYKRHWRFLTNLFVIQQKFRCFSSKIFILSVPSPHVSSSTASITKPHKKNQCKTVTSSIELHATKWMREMYFIWECHKMNEEKYFIWEWQIVWGIISLTRTPIFKIKSQNVSCDLDKQKIKHH